jgi:hypothetical protein
MGVFDLDKKECAMTYRILTALLVPLMLVGCASTPKPEYIPANTYQGYDCTQLHAEYNRVSQYLSANQTQSGITMSGVGIGIGIGRGGIYPSVNVGVGQANSSSRNNIAIALGQRDAIIQAGRIKQCMFVNGHKLYNET